MAGVIRYLLESLCWNPQGYRLAGIRTLAVLGIGVLCYVLMTTFFHTLAHTPAFFRSRADVPIPPNLYLEHEESWVKCAKYTDLEFTHSHWHVVLSQFNPLAFQITLDLLRNHHNVLLIVSRGNDKLVHFYADVMTYRRNLIIADYDTEYDGQNFETLVGDRRISHVHLAFFEHDFSPVYPVETRVSSQYRLVGILEYVSQPQHRNITVLDHVQTVTNSPVSYKTLEPGNNGLLAVVPDILNFEQFHLGLPAIPATCSRDLDHREHTEVFFKALDTYLFTFRTLYNLSIIRILH